jgi:fluoride ion exporter CrcB/FEX
VLYGWKGRDVTGGLVTINLTTGAATPIGVGIGSKGAGLAFNPFGILYAANNGATTFLRTVNKTTGATTDVAAFTGAPAGFDALNALAFNSAGVLYGSNSDRDGPNAHVNLVTINTTTGAITTIAALPNDTDALAFQTSSFPGVPAPSTLIMVLIGLAVVIAGRGLVLSRRRTA